MSNQTKNQHYVPQFILRNFKINEKEQIHVFDKEQEKTFVSNIRNVASENYFYDIGSGEGKFSFEDHLGDLEASCAEIFKKIQDQRNLKSLTIVEREWVATFIAVQMVRTKHSRVLLKSIDNNIRQILTENGGNPENVEGYTPFHSDDDLKEVSIRSIITNAKDLVPLMMNKKWILYTSDNDFWISDNPIAKQNTFNQNSNRGTLGVNNKGVELYFPISPSCLISFFCEETYKYLLSEYLAKSSYLDSIGAYSIRNFVVSIRRSLPIKCNEENITNFNSFQVSSAERFVYSYKDNFQLVRQMISDNEKYKIGPRFERMF